MTEWTPPIHWKAIKTIDAHAAGEPLRVITGGFPEVPGDTILAKRRYLKENWDKLRTGLMWEPRGHADMYGVLVTEPVTPDGDLGVLFMHNEGYSTMCGHGIIGLTKVGLDTGLIRKEGENPVIRIDSPAGRVTATAHRKNGTVESVSFLNVPSFVFAQDQKVNVEGIGEVRYDVAFGGAFYAYVRADEIGIGLEAKDFRQLIDWGMRIKRAVMESLLIRHPFEEDLGFLYGTIFTGAPLDSRRHSRNVCIFAEGEVDRSPTGTGVSGRAALHYARSEVKLGEPFTVESIIGTCFTGRVVEETRFGPYEAVIPEISGSASIVGVNILLFDPQDALDEGFILR
jgi:trans-L-3-hydroxyproline dehydratase